MVESYDAGSLPFDGDLGKYVKGAGSYEVGVFDESADFFEQNVVRVFLDKLSAGLDIPNFPQFRDMNAMFFSMMDGLERIKEGYVETGRLMLKHSRGCLAEVSAIKKNAGKICEKFGRTFRLKVCVTGPYTLASFFPYKTSETFARLGEVVAAIVESNIFAEKAGIVAVVSVDEPVFGLVDDALIDRGAAGRESLFRAWEDVFRAAKSRGAVTCLHLHSTADGLFWGVKGLDVVESHVDDSLYSLRQTREFLEREGKVLKASVCVNDFDRLIRESIAKASGQRLSEYALNQEVAEVWKKLKSGEVAG